MVKRYLEQFYVNLAGWRLNNAMLYLIKGLALVALMILKIIGASLIWT